VAASSAMKCRNCGLLVSLELIDLGSAPLSNAYLTSVTLRRPEKWFPLRVLICEACWLVQAEAYSRSAEIFDESYAYFSSFSTLWLDHAKKLCETMTARLGLTRSSLVVEIGSNDGYLLRNFVNADIRCLGIEPTASTASAARLLGVPTLERFFDEALAHEVVQRNGTADLVVAINVFAHVPYPREVLRGVRHLLSQRGVFSVEFPHLVALIENVEFDTIYHEHFSYFSFTTVVEMMRECGLTVIDVEELPTHGGSLRVLAMRDDSPFLDVQSAVDDLVSREMTAGVKSKLFYSKFASRALQIKNEFIEFLIEQRGRGRTVVGYGAAAKGNTLLNFAGVRKDLMMMVADRNPAKIGKHLPGSRIPIVTESELKTLRPDFVVILPWNLKSEITEQLDYVRKWGGKLVVAVPHLQVL
jgi:SAM-dependent methyltransferase